MKTSLLLLALAAILMCGLFFSQLKVLNLQAKLATNEVFLKQREGQIKNMKTYEEQFFAFKKALAAINPADYNKQTNNCYDHSKALQKKLAELGIESSIFINKGRTHAWLGVWVEATNGEFISPKNNFNILEIRDENLEVVCS